MNQFVVKRQGEESYRCLFEVRGCSFEDLGRVAGECMSEVDGLFSVGCSGGVTLSGVVCGSSVDSVIRGVVFCVDELSVVIPKE